MPVSHPRDGITVDKLCHIANNLVLRHTGVTPHSPVLSLGNLVQCLPSAGCFSYCCFGESQDTVIPKCLFRCLLMILVHYHALTDLCG